MQTHRLKTAAALLLALLLPLAVSRAAETDVLKADRLLTYKTVGEVTLKLHVFEPIGLKASDHRPAVVFFFGGGWSSGDAKHFYQQARALADLGMVAFSADYRVKSRNQTTPFECVKDAKSAIRWVRAHAAELGVDPNRIVAGGGSAGGHIAACTGIIAGSEEAGENLKISSRPNAMILFNPVLDTTEKGFGADRFKPDQRTELSPCHQVGKGIAPTIVFHGTADKTVPFENAERFARLMKEAGNDCVLVPFADKDHGFFNGAFFRQKSDEVDFNLTMKHTIEFLTAHGCLESKVNSNPAPKGRSSDWPWGFEYTAKYNLGNEVRDEAYRIFEGKYLKPAISPKGRGSFSPICERIIPHYNGRKSFNFCMVGKWLPRDSLGAGAAARMFLGAH